MEISNLQALNGTIQARVESMFQHQTSNRLDAEELINDLKETVAEHTAKFKEAYEEAKDKGKMILKQYKSMELTAVYLPS